MQYDIWCRLPKGVASYIRSIQKKALDIRHNINYNNRAFKIWYYLGV